MSFDSISAGLLLKVFDRLPFKDRVRLRGVNRLFNEVSDRSINKMLSLKINGDLEAYSCYSQAFLSLLESCSSTLESIDVTNGSCSNLMLSALTEFVYPKLVQLKITVTNNDLTKKLISRNRHLRSVILYLSRQFEWPKDIVFEKLEILEIHSSKDSNDDAYVDLSPTVRPLIGNVPNLECLHIHGDQETSRFILSVQEFSQLLASTPCLESLDLRLFPRHGSPPSGLFVSMHRDFVAAMPTWHLPNLTYLLICMTYPFPSSILQHFSNSSSQLKALSVVNVLEIDDQALMALSKLKGLRKFGEPCLEMTKDKFSKMITLLPSITNLGLKKVDPAALPALSQLQHLRLFHVNGMVMTRAQIIDVIANLPWLSCLGISAISDACSPEAFIDFLTTTAALIQRYLEIRIRSMRVNGTESELNQMKAVLEKIEKSGGPEVEMNGGDIRKIYYYS